MCFLQEALAGWLAAWLVTSEKEGVKKTPARSEKERVMDTEESGAQRGMWNGKNVTRVFKMGRRTRHVPSFVFFILILFSILLFSFSYLYIFIGLFGWFYYKIVLSFLNIFTSERALAFLSTRSGVYYQTECSGVVETW